MKNSFSIMILFLLSACGGQPTQTEKENVNEKNAVELTAAQLKNAKITVEEIKQQEISGIIKVSGKIDVPPQNLVSISVPFGGYLKSTKLLPGMHVNNGEVIAVLEDQQYIQLQQDYLTTQSKLTLAEAEYLRQKELNESKASSDKIFQSAKAEYEALKISLAALNEKLSMINIDSKLLNEKNMSRSIKLYAPFEGFVSKVNVNIGKYLNPTDVLFELVNPDDIHLNLTVFEKDLSQLDVGQKLIAYSNTHPEKKYNCEILLVSKDIANDRSAEVHCHFEKYDKNLLPGMYMNAEISSKNLSAYVVPDSAVVSYEGNEYVFVATSTNKYLMQEIKAGLSENGLVELKNGESFKNKKIVTGGAYTLLMALKNKSEG